MAGSVNYNQLDPAQVEFVEVADMADLTPGERLFLEIDHLPIVVFEVAGRFFAIADICSHDNNPLGDGDLEGYEIVCPRHGARFDIRSGKVCMLPAVEDIPAYPVRVVDGKIEVGIPV